MYDIYVWRARAHTRFSLSHAGMNISPGVGLVGAVRYTMRVGPVPSRPVSSAASHRGLCCPDATMSTGLTTAKRFGATAATSAAAKPGGLKAITPCRVACRCQPVWTINRMSVGGSRSTEPSGREAESGRVSMWTPLSDDCWRRGAVARSMTPSPTVSRDLSDVTGVAVIGSAV